MKKKINNTTLVEKIIKLHSKKKKINVGEFIKVNVDHIYIQDGNSHTIADLFKKYNFKKVFNNKKISFFFDHSVLSINKKISSQIKKAIKFAFKIKANIYNRGEGISHILALEKKIFTPNSIILGSDSHTCTGGIVQSLSLGMGLSDIIYAMITGKIWIKVPDTINIKILGNPKSIIKSKDIILYILKKYGQEKFLYKSIEIDGKWIRNLSMDSSITISNMAVELGAKCIFLPKNKNIPFKLKKTTKNNSKNNLFININKIQPQVSIPHYTNNVTNLNNVSGIKINYVFIGSCANSSLEDMKEISIILKKRKIHKKILCIVSPGSKNIYLKSIKKGYINIMLKSGVIISPPSCGPCVGTQGSIPANKDKIMTTMNRNFQGRMGNSNCEIYISSPLVAIYTACLGKIPSIRDLYE